MRSPPPCLEAGTRIAHAEVSTETTWAKVTPVPAAGARDADRASEHRGNNVRGSGPVETFDHQAMSDALPGLGTTRPARDSKYRKEVIVIWPAEVTPWRRSQRPQLKPRITQSREALARGLG